MTDQEPLTLDGLAALTAEVSRPSGAGDASTTKSFNAKMIAALRAGNGQVGGDFAGRTMLIITTTGRRTGRKIATVLRYNDIDGRLLIVASMGGAARHPQWYLNLLADPTATIELDGRTSVVTARTLEAGDREQVFPEICRRVEFFAEYQAKSPRTIPVVELVPADFS